MDKNYILLRSHIEEICRLTDQEWNYIKPFFIHKKLRKHQFLTQKHEPAPFQYWIIKGLLKTYSIDKAGREHVLHFVSEQQWTSDFGAYQNQISQTIEADCIEDSEFFCLFLKDREHLCVEIPKMAHFFRIKSHLAYTGLLHRILSLLTETAADSYHDLIQNNPDLLQRVPERFLASYLGVTSENLKAMKG
ncbi:Crp/Fnr family transcriptional regulator [Flavobacterium ginsengiterrae]|jgi:CRP-like cAMP-binding protein|uniref:Crp/Fnr family transcriptional regulator n=1 Tax=Flavobacterium ginsengiterrae TaxID=871695 RepID=A0ABP7G3Z0_9FLAO